MIQSTMMDLERSTITNDDWIQQEGESKPRGKRTVAHVDSNGEA
jgi:hypothetical protein